jgi:sulfate permease, SulP family
VTKSSRAGDLIGSFADGAILFPLVAALSLASGFSGTLLLASAGLAYIVSGFIFKVPMSIQPLKSIAVAAIAVGASSGEVRWAGAILGMFCLLASLIDVDSLSKKIPVPLIHGVQAGLGIMLIQRGLAAIAVPQPNLVMNIIPVLLIFAVIRVQNVKGINLLGLVATLGISYAIFSRHSTLAPDARNTYSPNPQTRLPMILALVLPQMALTLANSVVATKDVCRRYFGAAAAKVTMRNLLLSIGAGNLLMAAVGGLPFCHGAGGVSAHYRAGARTWIMNLFIGGFLLALAFVQHKNGQGSIGYPPALLGVLLASTGFFHMRLAADSWQTGKGRFQIAAMVVVSAASQNILWALCAGVAIELCAGQLRIIVRRLL